MGLKLAYMSTQTQLHMDVLKTVDYINISIKHYNGFVIHVGYGDMCHSLNCN